MNLGKLKKTIKNLGEPDFRFRQIRDAVYKHGILDFSEMSNVPKALAQKLEEEVQLFSFEVDQVLSSRNGLSHKALLKLSDGNLVETVLLSPISGKWSACVSSQVGCHLGCRFCATGKLGFKRDLKTEEIIDQVLFWKNFVRTNKLLGTFSNIVFMGMGEPFLNYREVKGAIGQLIDEEFFNFAARHISVSTSGVTDGIRSLAKDFPQVNLAISLIFPDNKQRNEYMPVNRIADLEKLSKAISDYIYKTNRKVFLEYIMFQGLNDKREDADKLIDFINSVEDGRKLAHVNLIRYNTATEGFKPSDRKTTEWFKNYLNNHQIKTTIRKSLGAEIKGACGQLAGK